MCILNPILKFLRVSDLNKFCELIMYVFSSIQNKKALFLQTVYTQYTISYDIKHGLIEPMNP